MVYWSHISIIVIPINRIQLNKAVNRSTSNGGKQSNIKAVVKIPLFTNSRSLA